MKKYVVVLLLLLAQNVCAMELSGADTCYKKCLLVAKYLEKYPQGKNADEKKKIDLFFSPREIELSDFFDMNYCQNIAKHNDRIATINVFRDNIKNPFLFMAICKQQIPIEVKEVIFNMMCQLVCQSKKQPFIDKMIKAYKTSFQTQFSAANINLKKDFRETMCSDLLQLLEKPENVQLTLDCRNYVDHPQWNPIRTLDCTYIIHLFHTISQEYQIRMSTFLQKNDDAAVEAYIKCIECSLLEDFRDMTCEERLFNWDDTSSLGVWFIQ